MKGNEEGIISENKSEVAKIKRWLAGTDVEKALLDVEKKEAQLEQIKQDLSNAKKKLARVLSD